MSARRFSRKRGLPSGRLRPHDDEAGTLFGTSFSNIDDRKTEQLCQQVHEALSLAFANCRDPSVRESLLDAVVPNPGPNQLRISVIPDEEGSVEALAVALERVRPYLRREVATYIHRKRTPELRFVVVPSEEANHDRDH